MSLRRYLLAVLAVNLAGWTLLVASAWEPALWAPGWQLRMLIGVPTAAGLLTLGMGWSASKTPILRRTGFLAYREANYRLAFIWTVIALIVACVRLGHLFGL